MATITLKEAQAHLAEIIERLTPGEELVLTRDDQPVATIKATPPTPAKRGDWWDALQQLRMRHATGGHNPRNAEEIDAELTGSRDEWEEHQLGIERLQEECRKQASAPPAEKAE